MVFTFHNKNIHLFVSLSQSCSFSAVVRQHSCRKEENRMTNMQVNYANLVELRRHNYAMEGETAKHNRETERQGSSGLAETARHNVETELINWYAEKDPTSPKQRQAAASERQAGAAERRQSADERYQDNRTALDAARVLLNAVNPMASLMSYGTTEVNPISSTGNAGWKRGNGPLPNEYQP